MVERPVPHGDGAALREFLEGPLSDRGDGGRQLQRGQGGAAVEAAAFHSDERRGQLDGGQGGAEGECPRIQRGDALAQREAAQGRAPIEGGGRDSADRAGHARLLERGAALERAAAQRPEPLGQVGGPEPRAVLEGVAPYRQEPLGQRERLDPRAALEGLLGDGRDPEAVYLGGDREVGRLAPHAGHRAGAVAVGGVIEQVCAEVAGCEHLGLVAGGILVDEALYGHGAVLTPAGVHVEPPATIVAVEQLDLKLLAGGCDDLAAGVFHCAVYLGDDAEACVVARLEVLVARLGTHKGHGVLAEGRAALACGEQVVAAP